MSSERSYSESGTIPGLQRTTPLRYVLRRARETRSRMRKRYFVYILANRPKGVLYVGVTNDLARRIWEHKTKIVPGSRASTAWWCWFTMKNTRPFSKPVTASGR